MAIKVQAKDTDQLEKELEEWSLGVNLVASSTEKIQTVKVKATDIKEDHSTRSTYLNREIKDDE